ncbi:hypothetical protein FPZ47_10165 [Mycobacterium helveticum]|uniref:Uncharacterized protein n=1 Tax=Mycobacterium helveticum TaxID=2592811 RepID=A0A557XW77_9MYCO|nr:hypothetical protein FPZ46_07225 [Mycobacterium helveticum]TVS90299.1 hypothetical protein FPZ47_10165 [Mycobacterium helveticum]
MAVTDLQLDDECKHQWPSWAHHDGVAASTTLASASSQATQSPRGGDAPPERDGPERDGPERDGPERDGPERDGIVGADRAFARQPTRAQPRRGPAGPPYRCS